MTLDATTTPPGHTNPATVGRAGPLRALFPATAGRGSFRWLFADVFRSPDLRRALPGLGVAALLYNLLGLAMALAILQIMDRVVVNQSHETLFFLAVGAFVAITLEQVMRALNAAVTGWIGARFEHRTTMAALEHLMMVPQRHLQREEPGAHVERVAAVPRVAEFYSGQALLVLFDLPFAPLFLLAIALIGGWVVLMPIAILLAFAWIGSRFAHWIRSDVVRHHVREDRRIGFLVEVLSGIHSVKTMMMEAQMQRRYERLQAGNVEIGESLAYSNAMASALGMVFAQIMTVGTIFASCLAVLAGHMTPGGLAACMTLAVRALQPLRRALVVWLRYQTILASRMRVEEIADMPTDAASGTRELPPVHAGIQLKDIRVVADDGTPILIDANLQVAAGECLLIDGRSGSGKTTLINVLAGVLAPAQGEVQIDGVPLAQFSPDSVHREIALLAQNGGVVAGTLLENLTLFEPAREPAAIAVAKAIGLHSLVADMKLGYETPLGRGNAETIAVGTRQLISIARALVCNPSVILFDEANTALDLNSDRALTAWLAAQKGQRTLVLVTHRPSLMALADRVVHLEQGRLLPGRATPLTAQTREAAASVQASGRPAPSEDCAALIRRQFSTQSDLASCLWPMLQALNWHGSARELNEALPHAEAALGLSDLCNVMHNLGFRTVFLAAAPGAVDARLLPCLFLPDNAPALVLRGETGVAQLDCVDSTGKTLLLDGLSARGQLLCFKRIERAESSPAPLFDRLGRSFRRHAITAFLLTLASTVLGLTAPLFVRAIYDHVLPTADRMTGSMLLLGVAIALGLDWHLRRIKSRLIASVGSRGEFIVGTAVFRSVLGLPLQQVESVPVNRQVSRLRSFETLREFFLGPMTVIAFELPANIAIVLAIAIINPLALTVIAAAGVVYALLYLITRGAVQRAAAAQSQATTARWEFLNETVTEMALVRASGRAATWMERFREISGRAVHAAYRHNQLQSRITDGAQVLGSLTGLAALAVSALICIRGEITPGTLIATTMLVWRITGPMQSFFLAITALPRIRAQMKQIETLVKLPPESETGVRQTLHTSDKPAALTFARVSFRYAADADPSLLGVQFSVQPGQVAVIAGNNGSGKSTLFKLATRAHAPQAGTVLLDNLDIRQMTISELRTRISYMPQNADIFHGTVAQNLRLVHPTASDEEVQWAVGMAGLSDDIAALAQGIETRISGSRADQLPNGFRQRLALARVMLKPAALVLLDEPGTGLDAGGVQALERCVAWLRGRSTVLMISHRPSHMRLADTVVWMNRGAVVASGAFDQIKERISTGIPQ